MVSGGGSWLHRFLTAHVGAHPREEGHRCRVSAAPLAQLLGPCRPAAAGVTRPTVHPALQAFSSLQGAAFSSRVSRCLSFLSFFFSLIQQVRLGLPAWPCGDPPCLWVSQMSWPWWGSPKTNGLTCGAVSYSPLPFHQGVP